MKNPLTLPILVCVLLCQACSPIAVSTDFDKETDFGKLKTFQWVPGTGGASDPQSLPRAAQFTENRVRKAVVNNLENKGYKEVSSNPDFLVTYETAVRTREWKSDLGRKIQYRTEYDEGTLVLEVLAPPDNSLLWQGVARGALGEFPSPEEKDRRVARAVKACLKNFPPQP